MNEEEIIKILNYQLKMKDTDVYTPINYDAIQGLLDLYTKQQKEIEKRLKEIDSLYKMMSVKDDEINYLEIKLEQYGLEYQILKDKIKELREIDNIDLIQFKLKELLVSGQESDQEGG